MKFSDELMTATREALAREGLMAEPEEIVALLWQAADREFDPGTGGQFSTPRRIALQCWTNRGR